MPDQRFSVVIAIARSLPESTCGLETMGAVKLTIT